MSESRLAPLSGVLFAAFVVVGFSIDANTEFMPPEAEIVAHLQEGPLRVMVGAYMNFLAAAALLWFSGSIGRALRRLDDDGGRLAGIATAGTVFASAMLAVGATGIVAAAERMWVNGSIEPGAAAGLFDVAGIVMGNGAPIGLAALFAATGVVMLRSEGMSRVLAWGSILLALGLLSPFGWVAMLLGILWVPAAGIWIYRAEKSRELLAVS